MLKYFLLFLFLIASLQLQAKNEMLDQIPKEDRQVLELFFKYIIHHSPLGYSLCGQKPVSEENFTFMSSAIPPFGAYIFFECYAYSILWKGWECWQRYAHLFPSKNFVLRFVPHYKTLYLVNKRAAKKAIEENLDLFHKFFDASLSSDEILKNICNPKEKEYLMKNHILLGILYGFGRNNAIGFLGRKHVEKLGNFIPHPHNIYIQGFLDPNFFIINDGTNSVENAQVRRMFGNAKKKMISQFKLENNFETFIKLYTE